MTDPLNDKDMQNLIKKTGVLVDADEKLVEVFETWGFDPDAIKNTILHAVKTVGEANGLPFNEDWGAAMVQSSVLSFVLGCMATMEIETRKQTGEENETE